MIQKTIAVIGGGISSLSFALSLAKKINYKQNIIQVNIYQRKQRLGGRITVQQSPQDEQHHHLFCADVGANFIDFQNEQQKKFLQANIQHDLLQKFKPFDGKFMIYQQNKLNEGQKGKQKQRYFYQGGFNKMPQDWKNTIEKQHTLNFNVKYNQIEKIQRQNQKWRLKFVGQQQKSEFFDILVFGTAAPQTRMILENSKIENTQKIIQQLNKIKYSKQLSAVFELQDKQMEKQKTTKPYSILFKDHQITFICFHNQKYPQSKKNIAVIQMNQQFTEKWSKKLSPQNKQTRTSHNQIQKQIGQQIWSLIPQDVRKQSNLTKKCLQVYYWPQSLIKPIDSLKQKNEIFNKFNLQLNKEFSQKSQAKNLYFTGDYLNNKSRVTGAMCMGIKLGQQVIKQHFKEPYSNLI